MICQNRGKEVRYREMTHPCFNAILTLWIADRDCQNTVRNIIDRRLPVPRRDRCSKDCRWLAI